MTSVPRVSFLMAVHNGAATLPAALASMLGQTLADIEIVVVDDGSTDATAEILRRCDDPRVRVLHNEGNRGLSWSLNRGWAEARGAYAARMDADDLCLPQRALRQAEFLDAHAEVAVVGSYVETFSGAANAAGAVLTYPTAPGAVAATILFRNALAHPAVMLRKAAIDAHGVPFDVRFRAAQDYGLWGRCVAHGLGLANIAEVLLRYRVHEGQLSQSFAEGMQEEGRVIRDELLRCFDSGVCDHELAVHNALSRDQLIADAAWTRAASAWLEKLARTNPQRRLFDQESLMRVLTGRYVALQRFAAKRGIVASDHSASVFASYIQSGGFAAGTMIGNRTFCR